MAINSSAPEASIAAPTVARVNFSAIPDAQRFDALNAYLSGVFDVDAPRGSRVVRAHEAHGWRAGSLFANRYSRRSDVLVERAARSFEPKLGVRFVQRGRSLIRHGEDAFLANGDAVHIFRMDHSFVSSGGDVEVMAITTPIDLLESPAAREIEHLSFPAASPTGRLITAGIGSLFETLPSASAIDAAALGSAFKGLLEGAIVGERRLAADSDAKNWARMAALDRIVDERLGDPQLAVPHICKDLGVSRAQLYRLLEPHGGVARYIQTRRVRRAAALLHAVDAGRVPGSGVAGQWPA